jgi:polyisoprenyl-phosphate glycosyltransferase
MERVTVVIPAYNEEGAIASVLAQIKALPMQSDIIVVDDGSTDRTGEIATAHGARVIRHPVNCGYGRSVKDAILQSPNDIIIVTDADGTYPNEKMPELLAKFHEGFDMIVGARHGPAYRGSFLKMPARIVFKFLVEFTTGRHIPDINSGLRVFRKSTVQRYLSDICDGFSFTTTITLIYLLTSKTVGYVQIPYHKRIGRSKVKIIRDSMRTMQYITEVTATYNPLKLFLLISVLLTILSLLFLIYAAIDTNGMALITSAVFFTGACIVFAMGLIADPVGKIRRQLHDRNSPSA